MECEESINVSSSETQLSDWSDRETKFEADDEQSDFFEASLTNLNIRQKKSAMNKTIGCSATRSAMHRNNLNGFAQFGGQSASGSSFRNPFVSNGLNGNSSTSGVSVAVWKKRRKNLENKMYN
jgi:hypothetical protein